MGNHEETDANAADVDGESAGWTRATAAQELSDGRPIHVQVGSDEVMLVRAGDRVFAVSNRCTHQGAPLDRGVVRVSGSRPSVACPAHGSMFSLNDGRVMRGPAMRPVASYEVRIRDDQVEVRPVVASGADA